ncbi:LytS/YhcK type 5TM receptor domain-containing protein, partial [Clostridiaceae bacterium HSG29]|nr:LytS/YhcK type 5TM receptor domain-containing protein [Clostridiaceae bacterium HSG29]
AVVGGLLGGPITGFIAGSIAGMHRFLIDINGFTAISCAISTTLEGLLAGFLSARFYNSNDRISFAIAIGIVAEVMQMVVILIVSKPFSDAFDLVLIIALPMIFMNSVGIGIFINIIENIRKIGDVEGAFRSYQTLLIADKALGQLRNGLDLDSANNIATTIYESTDFDAVSITDKKKILAHIGLGSKNNLPGQLIKTELVKKIIEFEVTKTINICDDINDSYINSNLKKVLIVPLVVNEKIIGILKLYKGVNLAPTESELALAKGLGQIFSTQLELSELEYQKNLRVKAELHALQAQINPHFLFNAINTIVSLTRTNQDEARELLIYLSDYFRRNMNNSKDLITLEEELNHVNAYLKIEKARFDDKLSVNIINEINDTVFVPPLIIQPIVENAIKHGILKKIDGGVISLKIFESNNYITIIILDNGVGIKNEKLIEIRKFNSDSVGINNVYRRLKTIFHEESTFKIDSELQNGTIVTIKLPVIKKMIEIGGLND